MKLIAFAFLLGHGSSVSSQTMIISCPVLDDGSTSTLKYSTSISGDHKRITERWLGKWEAWCTNWPNGSLTIGDQSAQCDLNHDDGRSTIVVDFFLKEYVIVYPNKDVKKWTCDLLRHTPD